MENIFKTIVDNSLIGIAIIQDDVVKYVNQAIANIFGYSIEEILNWRAQEFIKVVHPDYRELVLGQIRKKQEGKDDFL